MQLAMSPAPPQERHDGCLPRHHSAVHSDGLATSGVDATSATLSWTASTDNVAVAGYRLFQGGAQVGTRQPPASATPGLACGTTYTLGVVAFDAAGNVSGTATKSVATTACADTTPPSTPSGLVTSAVAATSATLSWTPATDNVGVTGYRLFQGGNQVGTSATTSFGYTGLTCATTYTLGVAAVDAAGNVSGTATKSLTTAACPDTTPPSTPAGLATSAIGQTSVALSWTVSTDDVAVTGYRAFRDGSQVGTPIAPTFSFTGLTCGTTYTLGVAAVDAAGNASGIATKSATTAACADTTPPATPTGLATSAVAATLATLSWTASTDNVGVTGYRLFQGGTQVGTSATTSFGYTGLTCATTYTLGVAAVDAAGNVSGTATKSLTTAACPDTTPPSTPAGLTVGSAGQTSLSLSWNASSDNLGVTGYRMFQNSSQVGTSISPGYIFGGLSCGTTYTLGVAAVDAAGNVSGTASVSTSTSACSGGGTTANVFVSPSGSDSTCARGDASKPCASLNAALGLAVAGDRVQLAGGTYGSAFGCNSANPRSGFRVSESFASAVTIAPAAGASVVIPCEVALAGDRVGFDATGGSVKIDGFRADGNFDFLTNTDVFCQDSAPYPVYTVTNIASSSPHNPAGGGHGFCSAPLRGSGNHFTMTGGSVGPTTADETVTGLDDSSIGYSGTPQYWTLNGVDFHDARWTNDCNGNGQPCHTENLYLTGVLDFTIENSHFEYCGNSACVFITKQSGQNSPDRINMYGNVFNHTSSPSMDYAADVSPSSTYTFAFNSVIDTSILASGGNVTMSSNIAYNNPCPGFSTTGSKSFDHNLWIYDTSTGGSADQCGSTDRTYNVGHNPDNDIWVNAANGDYHLKTGTNPAVDAGSTSYSTLASPDYFGKTRNCGSAPDVGAAERCP